MENDAFSDEDFFRALSRSGARALLIGRRALVALGAPVMTADYDLWLHADDIEALNAVFEPLGHHPNHDPATARSRGRYVIENGERVDVLVARASSGHAGETLRFDDAWERRRALEVKPGLSVQIPCLADLITTKRWAGRAKDIVDLQFLEQLRAAEASP